jgi:hypothetical protein
MREQCAKVHLIITSKKALEFEVAGVADRLSLGPIEAPAQTL